MYVQEVFQNTQVLQKKKLDQENVLQMSDPWSNWSP